MKRFANFFRCQAIPDGESEINEREVRERLSKVESFQRDEGSSPFAHKPSIMDELKALRVSEPTEEEKFLRREEAKIRRALRHGRNKG